MNEEIEALFNICDTDQSGFLEAGEIKEVFSKIGINLGQEELTEYISNIDKNNKISKEAFKIIMEDRLKNEMLSASSMQDQLRILFNKYDINKIGELNREQL